MPRVNRDLQRRMAARRERDRRRPSNERQYRFTTPETNQALEADEAQIAADQETTEAVVGRATPRRARILTSEASTSSPRGSARPAPRPFSAYAAEYAYVLSDLRRVAMVIGSLLVILLLLYFVLPR